MRRLSALKNSLMFKPLNNLALVYQSEGFCWGFEGTISAFDLDGTLIEPNPERLAYKEVRPSMYLNIDLMSKDKKNKLFDFNYSMMRLFLERAKHGSNNKTLFCITTVRSKKLLELTLKQLGPFVSLASEFPDNFAIAIFMRDADDYTEAVSKKINTVKTLNPDTYFEDELKIINELISSGYPSISVRHVTPAFLASITG